MIRHSLQDIKAWLDPPVPKVGEAVFTPAPSEGLMDVAQKAYEKGGLAMVILHFATSLNSTRRTWRHVQ